MKPVIVIAAALAALLMGACNDNSGDPSESNLLDTQQQALDRARQVEKDVADAASKRAGQIERSEDDG